MTGAHADAAGKRPGPDAAPARPKDAVQSLERAVAVLTAFDATHATLTLTELAERCRLPRSAARRFAHTLVELGYVAVVDRRFRLTPQVLELGYANLTRFTLADVCHPHLERLAHSLQTSASVSVLDGTDVRYISRVDVLTGMSVSLRAGSRVPAHRTAAGKVLLSLLTEHDRDTYFRATANTAGPPSQSDRKRLTEQLAIIAQQGWAFSDQALDVGVQALAVPLRSRDGEPVGALAVTTYEAHDPSRVVVSRNLPSLLEAAARISLELRAGIEA